jgi:hypothetical protein
MLLCPLPMNQVQDRVIRIILFKLSEAGGRLSASPLLCSMFKANILSRGVEVCRFHFILMVQMAIRTMAQHSAVP